LTQPSSKTASLRRQPTRWTRRRIAIALAAIFLGGLVAAVLDLRFVIGGAPRAVEPNSVLVIDAQTLETLSNRAGSGPAASPVVRGAGLVWTVNGANNHLFGTNPESGRVVRDEVVGTEPVAVAIGYGAAWVANAGNGSVTRVPLTSEKIETIGLSDQPSAISTGAGYVWVLSKRSGKVIRIDPKTKQVDKTLRLANPPLVVAVRNGRVSLAIGD
jgi:streptogramin lyase